MGDGHVATDGCDLLADGGGEVGVGGGGAEDEGHGGARRERVGDVNLRTHDRGEGVVLDVVDDADDDGPVALELIEALGESERLSFWPMGSSSGQSWRARTSSMIATC